MTGQDLRVELLNSVGGLASADSLRRRLDTTPVVINADLGNAALALSMANILARLIPNVTVTCSSGSPVSAPPFGEGTVGELAETVVGRARLAAPGIPSNPPVVIRAGAGDDADLFVSASTWSVRLSDHPHLPLSGNGPATSAASALAAAEAVRRVVPELPGIRLTDQLLEWNLLDYRLRILQAEPPPGAVSAVCFGAGSVGSSVAYSLLVSQGRGNLTFVDPDRLSTRNKLRYPLLVDGIGQVKTDWLRSFTTDVLKIAGANETAARFILNSPAPISTVVAAVDSVPARRDITDALARDTLEAGVDGLQFHISRHAFGDGYACAYCSYVDLGDQLDQIAVYAGLTGLSADRIAALLAGDALGDPDLRTLVEKGKLDASEVASYLDHRLQDLIRARLYAQGTVTVGQADLAISAPYVSALAGAVLAAELQKTGDLETHRLDRRIDIDCSGYPTGVLSRPLQDPSGRCLCHDRFRIDAYAQHWPRTDTR